jgi:hypothetical protein
MRDRFKCACPNVDFLEVRYEDQAGVYAVGFGGSDVPLTGPLDLIADRYKVVDAAKFEKTARAPHALAAKRLTDKIAAPVVIHSDREIIMTEAERGELIRGAVAQAKAEGYLDEE